MYRRIRSVKEIVTAVILMISVLLLAACTKPP